jgi:AraC-like DNA-binding protein
VKRFNLFPEGDEKIFTLMKICDLGDEEIVDNQLPHLHEFYSIFWIEKGEALHATDFVEYSLLPDTILFVPPGLKHRMYLDKSVEGNILLFNEEFIRYNRENHIPLKEYKLFNNPDYKSLIVLDQTNRDHFRRIIDMIFREINRVDSFSQDVILNLLHLFLLESRRLFNLQYQPGENLSAETPDATIIRFKSLVEDNYKSQKNVSAYADMLRINPSCLNEVSKKTTGITAGELIRNRVIDEAKKLLFATNQSGKEIAFELGFDDPSYFSRFFKKYTGLTLNEFRRNSRKKYH